MFYIIEKDDVYWKLEYGPTLHTNGKNRIVRLILTDFRDQKYQYYYEILHFILQSGYLIFSQYFPLQIHYAVLCFLKYNV